MVQTKDSKKDDDDEPDMSILYEKEETGANKPEKINILATVPVNTELVETMDDDPNKIEGFLMEDPKIPLNLRLLQTKQDGHPLVCP